MGRLKMNTAKVSTACHVLTYCNPLKMMHIAFAIVHFYQSGDSVVNAGSVAFPKTRQTFTFGLFQPAEPPDTRSICLVVWEGGGREVTPYPDRLKF